MYFFLNSGITSMANLAQCGQEAEAYSVICTLAFGSPMDMSSFMAGPLELTPLLQAARVSAAAAASIRRRLKSRMRTPPVNPLLTPFPSRRPCRASALCVRPRAAFCQWRAQPVGGRLALFAGQRGLDGGVELGEVDL